MKLKLLRPIIFRPLLVAEGEFQKKKKKGFLKCSKHIFVISILFVKKRAFIIPDKPLASIEKVHERHI